MIKRRYPTLHPIAVDQRDRSWNLRRTDPWSEAVHAGRRPVDNEEALTPRDLLLELLMTGFRTYRGIDNAAIERRFGVDLFAANAALVRRLRDTGLVKRDGSRLIPTLDGLAVADSLATMFRLGSPGHGGAGRA